MTRLEQVAAKGATSRARLRSNRAAAGTDCSIAVVTYISGAESGRRCRAKDFTTTQIAK